MRGLRENFRHQPARATGRSADYCIADDAVDVGMGFHAEPDPFENGRHEFQRPAAFEPAELANAIDRQGVESKAPMLPPDFVEGLASQDYAAVRQRETVGHSLKHYPRADGVMQAFVEQDGVVGGRWVVVVERGLDGLDPPPAALGPGIHERHEVGVNVHGRDLKTEIGRDLRGQAPATSHIEQVAVQPHPRQAESLREPLDVHPQLGRVRVVIGIDRLGVYIQVEETDLVDRLVEFAPRQLLVEM